MWRTSAVTFVVLVGMGLARAEACAPLPSGGLLCEEEGAYLFVDPASGTVVDVTQEVLSAMSESADSYGSAIVPDSSPVESGTFEDRLSDLCSDGSCPTGLTSAIDGITGYIPSYQ